MEFTSRYGDGEYGLPSALRICRGDCEGMGWYPACHDRFVTCERCNGSGRCGWRETIARVPGWFRKSLAFYREYSGRGECSHWIVFRIAFIDDIRRVLR